MQGLRNFKKDDPQMAADLLLAWFRNIDENTFGRYEEGSGGRDRAWKTISAFLLATAVSTVHRAFTTNDEPVQFLDMESLGLDVIDWSKPIPPSVRTANYDDGWAEVFDMLGELEVETGLLRPVDSTTKVTLVHGSGWTKRSGSELGRLYYRYDCGINLITRPVYCLSLLPNVMKKLLVGTDVLGYCSQDIKRAFGGIPFDSDLAGLSIVKIGNNLYSPTGGPIGLNILPAIWIQVSSHFNRLVMSDKMIRDFCSDLDEAVAQDGDKFGEILALLQKLSG